MSIFCSFGVFGEDGEYPPPIYYQGSHILPTDDDYRDGHLDLGLIPSFISRDGDMGPEDEVPLPWLRISMGVEFYTDATVILDKTQVRQLIAELGRWFFRPGEDVCKPCVHCDGLGTVETS